MTITASQTVAPSAYNFASGKHLDDAATPAAFVATIGFKPRYVKFVNLTDRTIFEFFEGMAATHTLKTVAAGTVTDDTNSAIVVSASGFTVAAANILQNKQYHWVAFD